MVWRVWRFLLDHVSSLPQTWWVKWSTCVPVGCGIRFAVHMYTFLKISFVQIYTFTNLQHLLVHSAIGLPIDAWLPSCSNEKKQPMFRCTTTSKRTGRLMFLFFRGTFVRLFVRFCLQSCFVFRRQSSKGWSTRGVVKGGLSHHDTWKIFVVSRCQ